MRCMTWKLSHGGPYHADPQSALHEVAKHVGSKAGLSLVLYSASREHLLRDTLVG